MCDVRRGGGGGEGMRMRVEGGACLCVFNVYFYNK